MSARSCSCYTLVVTLSLHYTDLAIYGHSVASPVTVSMCSTSLTIQQDGRHLGAGCGERLISMSLIPTELFLSGSWASLE